MKKSKIITGALVASLVLPAAASAHVTVQPDSAPAGGFTRLDVRVPNERDDAATEKVEVQMPDGFIFVSYEPVEGWSTEIKKEKLDEPIEAFGEEYTEQVDTVTFTAEDAQAAIQPDQFRDFGLSVGVPGEAVEGDVLEFPAIQTYDSGEVVRWIEPEDGESPAATVTVTAAEEEHHAAEEDAAEDAADAGEEASDDDGDSNGLAIAGLVVGGLGLITGGTALARSRR